jgi:hypothetical protein
MTPSSTDGPATPATIAPFPHEAALKLAGTVRKAQETGELTTTFSLRKLQLWGELYTILQVESYSAKDALAAAFHLAVQAKTYGDERTFLNNVYQAVFGDDPKPPVVKPPKGSAPQHPQAPLLRILLKHRIPVWLYGMTGVGKSFTVRQLSEELQRPFVRCQATGDMTVDDLLGGMGAHQGSTHFEHGPLPQAMRQGAILNIDEISFCSADVDAELHAVLEGAPLVIKKNRGEVVQAADGFTLVVNDNTLGLGERPEHVGTKVKNEAFRDRFAFLEFTHLPTTIEDRIVRDRLEALAAQHSVQLIAPASEEKDNPVATAAAATPPKPTIDLAKAFSI